jgi:elongator complex protein 3
MKIEELIIKYIDKNPIKNRQQLDNLKRSYAKRYQTFLPSNVELLKAYHKLVENKTIKKNEDLEKFLITLPGRSLSGIVNISVLTKPYPCPGQCVFCPIESGFPKSYLKGEPAADRAFDLNYDPYWQVKKRLEMLVSQGHNVDKMELRIIGGTWSFYPKQYRTWFIKRCFEAANSFGKTKKSSQRKNLLIVQKENEKAKVRIVGLSIETRPDYITEEEVKNLRQLGVTMVELGVQSVFNDVLAINQTGLTEEIIAQATKILRQGGFKILYHLMPNLYGSNREKDLLMFQKVFNDKRFKPDWIKIYPVVVMENTKLFQLWKEKKYQPYTDEQLTNLLIEIKKLLPYWVRVARIIRDIPAPKIVAGTKISNLREIIQREMKKKNLTCHCIRCREIRGNYNLKEKIFLFREDYEVAQGKEIFLTFENKDRTKLFSLLRLFISDKNEKPIFNCLKNSSIIREIRTYGELVPLEKKELAPQHRGLGKKIIKEAEKITQKEFHLNKIAVIASVGTRDYFRKQGFRLEESYMTKNLNF